MSSPSEQHVREAVATLRHVQGAWAAGNTALHGTLESVARMLVAKLEVAELRRDCRLRGLSEMVYESLRWSVARCDDIVEGPRLDIKRAINELRSAVGAASIWDRHWPGLSAVLRGPAGPLNVGIPPKNATVEDIHTWWMSLDDHVRSDVVEKHGQQLGRIDGIPIPVRSQCHEADLPAVRERLRRELADLQQRAAGKRRQVQITGILRGLDTVEHTLAKERAAGREAYLIDLDTERWGAIRLALGNPHTAQRVVTYVAGGGTSLGNPGGALKDASNVMEITERLHGGPDDPPDTAVILNVYQVRKPARFSAVDPSITRTAATSLARFQHGLRVTHAPLGEGDPPTRWVGLHHCLGSVVGAKADRMHGYSVDAFVIMGIDATGFDHADNFGVPDVYATMMDNDPLRRIRGLSFLRGRQPTDEKFGATVFASGSGRTSPARSSARTHLLYLRDTETLLNVAEIILGNPPYHSTDRPAHAA